jgi:DNA-directed RNA polymerase subunit RPC12/RpoP
MKKAIETIKETLLEKRANYAQKEPIICAQVWNDFDEVIEIIEDIEAGLFCTNCGSTGIGILYFSTNKKSMPVYKCLECGKITDAINLENV